MMLLMQAVFSDLERMQLDELLAYADQGHEQEVQVGLELIRRKRKRLVLRKAKREENDESA